MIYLETSGNIDTLREWNRGVRNGEARGDVQRQMAGWLLWKGLAKLLERPLCQPSPKPIRFGESIWRFILHFLRMSEALGPVRALVPDRPLGTHFGIDHKDPRTGKTGDMMRAQIQNSWLPTNSS